MAHSGNKMDSLLGQLRQSVCELRNQGDDLTNQVWLLYVTFEDFMHIQHPEKSQDLMDYRAQMDLWLQEQAKQKRCKEKALPLETHTDQRVCNDKRSTSDQIHRSGRKETARGIKSPERCRQKPAKSRELNKHCVDNSENTIDNNVRKFKRNGDTGSGHVNRKRELKHVLQSSPVTTSSGYDSDKNMSPPNVPSGDNTDDVTGGVGEPEFYDLENEDSYLTAFDKTEQRRRHKYEKRHRRHHQKRVTSSKPQMVPFGARLMDKSSVLNQVQEHNYKLSTVTHSMHQIIRDLRPEHTSHARENAKTPQSKTPRHEMSSKQNVDCVDACKSMTNSARQRQRQTAGVPTDEHAFVDDSAMRTRKEKELERRPYISLVTRAPLSSVNNGVTKQPCDKQIFRTRVQNDVNVSQTKKHATMHASLPSSRHELLVDGRRDNGEYLEPVSSKDRTGVSPSHAQRANGLSTAHRPLPARQGLRRFASETHLNASQHARGEDTPWGCSLRDIQHNTNEASMVSLQSVDSTKSTLTYYGSMMNLSSYENLHRKSSSGMIITDDGLGIERSKTPYGQKTDCSLNSNEGGQSTFSSDSGFHQEYDLGEYLAEEPIYETIRDDDVISYDGGHMTVKPTPPKLPSRNGILKRAVSELSLIDHNAAMPCKDGNFIRFSNDEKSRSRLSLRKLKQSFRTSRVMGRLFKNGAKEQTTNNVSNAHASIPNSQKGAGTSTRNPGIPQCHNTSVSTVVPKENPKEQAKVEQTTPNNRCAPSHREYNNNEKRENGVNLSPKSRDNLYNLLKDKDMRLFFSESLAQERKLRDSPPLNNERYVKSVGLGTIRSSNLNSNFLAFRVPDRVNIMSRSVYC